MLGILAQASQPAAESWWTLVFSQLIDLVKMLAPLWYVIAGSGLTYVFAIKRERKLRVQARKEEIPWRTLGILQECRIIAHANMKARIVHEFGVHVRVPSFEGDIDIVGPGGKVLCGLEDAPIASDLPLADSFGRLMTSLGELRGLYVGNRAVMKELDAALAVVRNFKTDGFEVPWSTIEVGNREEMTKWVQSQQSKAGDFVTSELVTPVRAAIATVIRDA